MTDLPNPDGSSPQRQKFGAEPEMLIDPSKTYTATMVTSKGTMEILLDPLAAPKAVNSFVFLARWHYFDGIVFHRIIPGFVLQGGDPTGSGAGGPGYRFQDELPKPGRYELGSLAWPMRDRTRTARNSSSSPVPTGFVFPRSTPSLARSSRVSTS